MKKCLVFLNDINTVYGYICKPLCKKYHLTQNALDILMFLANNPECKSAGDIVKIRKLKANLVSINVEKMVREGYLCRRNVEGDRRKIELICTDKANPIIEEGRKIQEQFENLLFSGMTQLEKERFQASLESMRENLEEIIKKES